MPDITMAYEGHLDKLKLIYGSGKDDKKKTQIKTMEDFVSAFGNKGE
jgi:hypothetical protein